MDIDSLKDEKKRKSLGMWLNGQTRPLIPHMPGAAYASDYSLFDYYYRQRKVAPVTD